MPGLSQAPTRARSWVLLISLLGCQLVPAVGRNASAPWAPIDPVELAENKPQLDPGAGAEILRRDTVISQRWYDDSTTRHYLRVKIYSPAGIDKFAKIELPYSDQVKIHDIAARTIKPDGSILELNPKDIYERELIAAGRARYKVKAFAPPGLEPGAIIEYRYTEESSNFGLFTRVGFQSEWPARKVVVRFSPMRLPTPEAYLRILSLHVTMPLATRQDKEGYFVFEADNLPAAKSEPFAPPDVDTQACVLLFYSFKDQLKPADYWPDLAHRLSIDQKNYAESGHAVRKAVVALVTPGDNDLEKARKIYEFCTAKIKNRQRGSAGFTLKQLEKLPANDSPANTLHNGSGTSFDINALFAAMTTSAGLDTRLVLCNRRSLMLFDPLVTENFMVPDLAVALHLDGRWRYFDPGATYLPFGTLSWWNSGVKVIMAAAKDGRPQDGYTESEGDTVTTRAAYCLLDDAGTLDGDVSLQFSGQRQAELKNQLDGMSGPEREKFFKDELLSQFKDAEVTRITVENAADPLAPLKASYHLHVPAYADRTGTRLFFQPALFQKNIPPLFDDASRRTDIIFHYPHTEDDHVVWTLPAGWEIEEGSRPGRIEMGALGVHDCEVSYNRAKNQITYHRTLTLAAIFAPRVAYAAVRAQFIGINLRDAHTLTFKRTTADPTGPSKAGPPVPK